MFLVSNYNFPEWLQSQLSEKGWSQSDLARAANLNRAVINKVLSGYSSPSSETLTAIARAFKLPQEAVFQAAGVLKPKSSEDAWVERQNYLLHQITDPTLKAMVEKLIMSAVEMQESNDQSKMKVKTAKG